MRVLVATITHSRPKGLAVLLDSLQTQKINDGISAAITVVDNDCTSNNDDIVNKRRDKPYPITLIKEKQQGIVYARNAAVSYFLDNDFDFLAFVDDDEWTGDEFWLQNLLKAQQQTGADIVTSDVFTVPEVEAISWTQKAMGRECRLSDLEATSRFYTGNVLISRHVLESIKPAFDNRFALTGSSDLHFCLKCKNAGYKSVYTDKAPVYEIFPKTRATMKWFFMRGYRNGSGAARSEIYEAKSKAVFMKLIIMAFARSGRGLLKCLISFCKLDKGGLALGVMRFASGVGTIAGIFDLKHEEYKVIHGQ